MAAEPVMVPVFVVGLPQLPASILALPDMDATVMPPDTVGRVIFAFPLISAWLACVARRRAHRAGLSRRRARFAAIATVATVETTTALSARARRTVKISVWCWSWC